VNIRTVNPEVYQAEGRVVWASGENVRFLKERAAENPRGRARLCAHPGPEDLTHEMLVCLRADNWIRPHYHVGMVESFHCVEGEMLVLLFNDDGTVLETVPMGDARSGRAFYYRQTKPTYHTLIVLSDFVVFQEVTQGPWKRENTVLAPWAPAEGTDGKLRGYIADLRARYVKA
jgi:cupin fold WbuC family metalloprotein